MSTDRAPREPASETACCECADKDRRIAELEAALDGDPSLTATPEERNTWTRSAIRYADKVERQRNKARARAEQAEKELTEERARLLALIRELEDAIRQVVQVALFERDRSNDLIIAQRAEAIEEVTPEIERKAKIEVLRELLGRPHHVFEAEIARLEKERDA